MSKTISFKVNVTFSEEVTSEKDIKEIAQNIARAIQNETYGDGIASDDCEGYTENVEVIPIGMENYVVKRDIY